MVQKVEEPVMTTQKLAYPVRFKFTKTGRLQYISHLDLNRTMSRAIIRAKIPVWYTEGFNPHPKLVFSSPLSVGVESVFEFCDIKTTEQPDCEKIKLLLQKALPAELDIIDVYTEKGEPFAKFSTIAWSEYNIEIMTSGGNVDLADRCAQLLSKPPLNIMKRSKKGEREIDLASSIGRVGIKFDENTGLIRINVLLPADSAGFINPELIVRALTENIGILSGDIMSEYYTILRTGLYLCDRVTVFE